LALFSIIISSLLLGTVSYYFRTLLSPSSQRFYTWEQHGRHCEWSRDRHLDFV